VMEVVATPLMLLKASLGDEQRQMALERFPTSFEQLNTILSNAFETDGSLTCKWEDEDGELITCANDADLLEALREHQGHETLELFLSSDRLLAEQLQAQFNAEATQLAVEAARRGERHARQLQRQHVASERSNRIRAAQRGSRNSDIEGQRQSQSRDEDPPPPYMPSGSEPAHQHAPVPQPVPDPVVPQRARVPRLRLARPVRSRNGMLPADQSAIEELPTHRYREGPSTDSEQRQCMICFDTLEEGHRMKTLPCMHRFHKVCLDKWLATSGVCPICKARV